MEVYSPFFPPPPGYNQFVASLSSSSFSWSQKVSKLLEPTKTLLVSVTKVWGDRMVMELTIVQDSFLDELGHVT